MLVGGLTDKYKMKYYNTESDGPEQQQGSNDNMNDQGDYNNNVEQNDTEQQ